MLHNQMGWMMEAGSMMLLSSLAEILAVVLVVVPVPVVAVVLLLFLAVAAEVAVAVAVVAVAVALVPRGRKGWPRISQLCCHERLLFP
jgi:hypothetical protein